MMYQGKYQANLTRRNSSLRKSKFGVVVLALLLLLAAVGGTLAYLMDSSAGLVNTFTPATVSVGVQEAFDGTVKRNVTAQNTGDVAAYVRICLVSYRVDDSDSDNHIGGKAEIPTFTPGAGWVKNGDFYYYTSPVEPNTAAPYLIGESGIKLTQYTDADGGKQVIEVIAEAIQAEPNSAVEAAWGVDPATLK